MNTRVMHRKSLLLLAFALSVHQFQAQTRPGFISLDCGLRDTDGYNDSTTGLYYSKDNDYVETGEGQSISPEFKFVSLARQFSNVRTFPGPEGTRSCYTLSPLYGQGNKVLLRVSFMYGNYDDLNKVPEFDLYLGVNPWETVTLENASSIFTTEILHIPTSNYLQVCLVNTGRGTPFMSILELRSLDPSNLIYNTTSGSLKLLHRWDFGSTSDNIIRYKDDSYDRTWTPVTQLANTIDIRTNGATFWLNHFNLSSTIMSTAAQALITSSKLTYRQTQAFHQ